MISKDRLPAFKAYDIRGRVPDELDRDLVVDIGRAFAGFLEPRRVAVGYDIRLSSPDFAAAVTDISEMSRSEKDATETGWRRSALPGAKEASPSV